VDFFFSIVTFFTAQQTLNSFEQSVIFVHAKQHAKVKQSSYRPEVPRGFQEVKVPGFRDNGTGRW